MRISFSTFLKKIRWLFYPYLVLLSVCILLMLIFSREELYFAVNHIHTDGADVFFTYITQLGASEGCIFIAVLAVLINYKKGFLLSSSYVITFIISQTIKHLVKAPRPHLFFTKKLHDIYLVKGVVMLDTNSFPSGHSVSAFTAAVVLTYVSNNKISGPLLFLIAALVAYSRLYLSEHFLQDVTVGSALGVFITSFWLLWVDNRTFLQNSNWNRGIFERNKE